MSGQTIVLPEEEADEDVANAVVRASQDAYATKYLKATETKKSRELDQNNTATGNKESRGDKQRNKNDALGANNDA